MKSVKRSTTPDYVVVGAGAIGGTLAYHLLQAGKSVALVDADREHVSTINTRGLQIQTSLPQEPSVPVQAYTPEDYRGTLGRVILAVKAQHTTAAVEWVAPRLQADGWVVSMQNGLNEDKIASVIGRERTVGAFVNLNADVIAPGVIHDGGVGALVVGELDGADTARTRQLAADLSSWGPVVTSPNIQGYLWAKLAYGAMLTATSLSNVPMAEAVTTYEATMTAVAREICAIAAAHGITLESFDAFNADAYRPETDPEQGAAATRELAAWLHTLSKKHSGIWRDIAVRKRKTEVPTHYAPVLDLSRKLDVSAPLLEAVLHMLAGIETGERELTEENLNALSVLTPTKVA